MSRRTAVNLVFFLGVFALLMGWAARSIVTIDRIERPYQISATFEQAAGVRADSEVTYLGVHYGRVAGVDRLDGSDGGDAGVQVTMKVDRGREIPEGSIARVFRKSAIGEPYIDFVPPDGYDGGGPYLAAGDHIPIEDTSVPLEFSELLKSASALISGIDPDDARIVVHELALALDGRGESLRQLTQAADELTSSFVTRTDELDRLATNNTRLTRIFAEHRSSLGSSITNLRLLADTLERSRGDLAVVLDEGSELLGTAAELVADEKGNLDCILGNAERLIDLASSDQQLANLTKMLDEGPTSFRYVWLTRDDEPDGVWVRVNLLVEPENPPDHYVPERQLPTVPGVPACASSLEASSGPSFTTAARPEAPPVLPAGGELPATGGRPLGVVVALLAAGALATWRLRARVSA
jgi:phospholipid/cholesterol/gamma-HCH transport system substrate-binding protein